MHKLKVLTISVILVMSLALAGLSVNVSARPLAATSPNLGAAASYSVLGAETVTNTGPTTLSGDLGVSPGSAITGFFGTVENDGPGVFTGTAHQADSHAADAQIANSAAFDFLDQGCGIPDWTGTGLVDLVGMDLVPGVYCADSFSLTGMLTLSGSGVWIFKSASTLITSGTANIVGSGNALDVWWRVVSSATLGTGTSLIGNILADTSISMATGATLNGRAFARTGSVTLDNNTIFGPVCAAKQTATAAAPLTATAAAPLTATAVAQTATAVAQTATATQPGGATATATTPPTATLLPIVTSLPPTGGAPIRNEDFPWSLVIVGGFSAIALVLGVRGYRRTHLPKQ